jgi:hypothetical protein
MKLCKLFGDSKTCCRNFLGLKVFDELANKIIGIESEKTRREIKNASAEK